MKQTNKQKKKIYVSFSEEGGEAPPVEESVDPEKSVTVKTRIKKVSPGVYTSEVSTASR